MRRRSVRTTATILLFAWTLAASLAAAQVCVGTPASHLHWHDHSAHQSGAALQHGNPEDSDDDCPLLPPAAVDAGSADTVLDLLLAIGSAPVLHVHAVGETRAAQAVRVPLAAPTRISAYLVAHRLRL